MVELVEGVSGVEILRTEILGGRMEVGKGGYLSGDFVSE